jgi:oxygen-independent coproporphyrinogen-3 oxidase
LTEKSGLYIHVPFCFSQCSYCDFYKKKAERVEDGYVGLVLKEASLYKEEEKIPLDTLYFGGGTPSLLEPPQLGRLSEGLGEVFEIGEGSEITIEANPETLTKEKLEGYRALGINRLSLGVQSLRDEVLAALSRNVGSEGVLGKLEIISGIGFDSLSCDLILGAPGSSSRDVQEDLGTLLRFPFDHVSLYMLDLHRGTRLYEQVKGGLSLPGEEEVMESYRGAAEFLKQAGFIHYEISNFAKKGKESRHNLKYWKREWTVALGPSAHGYFRGTRTKNPASLDEWSEKLERGEFPYEESFEETPEEKLENEIIFGLRLGEGVDRGSLDRYLGAAGRETEKALAPLLAQGYAREDGGRLKLTFDGFCLSNEVISFILSDSFGRKRGEEGR